MKVAVVGVGGTGSAAARFLARAGHEVVAFEQFEVGHTLGSSHGESRIIRYTYADEVYTHMMGEAYPLWRALEEDAGEDLLARTGGVFFGDSGGPVLAAAQAALDGHRVPYEMLTAGEIQRRFPALRLADDETALYQPDMGYLRATGLRPGQCPPGPCVGRGRAGTDDRSGCHAAGRSDGRHDRGSGRTRL